MVLVSMFPSIEPKDVGNTGLLWLFGSYGYVLFRASGLISEGSELLLLIPSLAGLVGVVVLPLLGAVPDGAIMLFSGMGDIETAQETLSVGVGALAGSTIMLLTVPWGLSIIAGKVDLNPDEDGNVIANYKGDQKLTPGNKITSTDAGVTVTKEIKHGAFIMMLTTVPYFLIQIPASYLEYNKSDDIASGEKNWAFLAFIISIGGFFWYLTMHMRESREHEQKVRRMEVMKNMLKSGQLSLGGVFHDLVKASDKVDVSANGNYQSIEDGSVEPSPLIMEHLRTVLSMTFQKYDLDGDANLSKNEVGIFFKDLHESISIQDLDSLFLQFDKDDSRTITLDEFVLLCYSVITAAHQGSTEAAVQSVATAALESFGEEEEEEEEIPGEIANLSPEKQEAAIKKMAFTMLALGTALVLLFSDPMVDVMQEIAGRLNISPFYVSFVLAPLASNASEVLASSYYASKKTTKTISVSFSTLLGASAMNNTFCLSIFMGLIFFRGLAWQYTAETIAIVLVQGIIYYMTTKEHLTSLDALKIIAIFPASIALIAFLESTGFN